MFQRRHPRNRRQKLRQAIWPSMGMKRLLRYYKHRIARLKGTPTQIAGGFAIGIAVSCTPFLGLHILIGLVFCVALRFSKMSMVMGTVVGGNPWTIPLISMSSYQLGHMIMGHAHPSGSIVAQGFTLNDLFMRPFDLLVPMMVGSLPLMLASGFLFFVIVKSFVETARAPKAAA